MCLSLERLLSEASELSSPQDIFSLNLRRLFFFLILLPAVSASLSLPRGSFPIPGFFLHSPVHRASADAGEVASGLALSSRAKPSLEGCDSKSNQNECLTKRKWHTIPHPNLQPQPKQRDERIPPNARDFFDNKRCRRDTFFSLRLLLLMKMKTFFFLPPAKDGRILQNKFKGVLRQKASKPAKCAGFFR